MIITVRLHCLRFHCHFQLYYVYLYVVYERNQLNLALMCSLFLILKVSIFVYVVTNEHLLGIVILGYINSLHYFSEFRETICTALSTLYYFSII